MTDRPASGADPAGRSGGRDESTEFLLQSIRDLDREHAAGDLDDDDHRALRDDYLARAAIALRAEQRGQTPPPPPARRRTPGQWALIIAGVVGFAVLSGVLMAQASGRRTSDQGVTGDIIRTPTQEAARCIELTEAPELRLGPDGELPPAVGCYQAVLEEDPDNPVALAYLGWTLVLIERTDDTLPPEVGAELTQAARRQLDQAVESDPGYADARAFQVVLAVQEERWDDAAAQLEEFDALNAPAAMRSLVDSQRQAITDGVESGG